MRNTYPHYWYDKGGKSDLEFVLRRMAVIPEDKKYDVCREYERLYRTMTHGNREAANKYLHQIASEYRDAKKENV